MADEEENPIPTHDARKTLKMLYVAAGLSVVLIIVVGLLVNHNWRRKTVTVRPKSETQRTAQIVITKDGFVPATLTIAKGTKVVWTNKDTTPHRVASNPHPTHEGLQGLDSVDVIGVNGGTYSFTFDKAGTFGYHDHLNPLTSGTIIVQ